MIIIDYLLTKLEGFQMKILSESEMWDAVTLNDVMDAIEDSYRIHKAGSYVMPDRFVASRDQNMMLYMPCFLDRFIGTKTVSYTHLDVYKRQMWETVKSKVPSNFSTPDIL